MAQLHRLKVQGAMRECIRRYFQREVNDGMEKMQKESAERTDAVVSALTTKNQLENEIEELKQEKQEMMDEFNTVLNSKAIEHDEQTQKLISALEQVAKAQVEKQELESEFEQILESRVNEFNDEQNIQKAKMDKLQSELDQKMQSNTNSTPPSHLRNKLTEAQREKVELEHTIESYYKTIVQLKSEIRAFKQGSDSSSSSPNKLFKKIAEKVTSGTLKLTVEKAHIVQMEHLDQLGDPYLTIEMDQIILKTKKAQAIPQILSNKGEQQVVVWNETIEIPVSDFGLKMKFRLFDNENEFAIQLGSGDLKPKIFTALQCPPAFNTSYDGKKTATIFLKAEWIAKAMQDENLKQEPADSKVQNQIKEWQTAGLSNENDE